MAQESLSATGFGVRLVFAQLLVLATVNPTGYSYLHWFLSSMPHLHAGHALAGVVLLAGWILYVNATLRSMGAVGVLLIVGFFASLVWLAVERGWLALGNAPALAWIGLIAAGVVLGIGMSWSFFARRLSGQSDVDEVNRH